MQNWGSAGSVASEDQLPFATDRWLKDSNTNSFPVLAATVSHRQQWKTEDCVGSDRPRHCFCSGAIAAAQSLHPWTGPAALPRTSFLVTPAADAVNRLPSKRPLPAPHGQM